MTELELRSQLYGWLGDRTADPDGDEWRHEPLQQLVHDLLALPEVAALREKAAAVERVRTMVAFYDRHEYTTLVVADIRRALSGDLS